MTTRLTLHIVDTATASARPSTLALTGHTIEEWFSRATNGNLVLTPRFHRLDFETDRCSAAILHRLAREVLPPASPGVTSHIALLFCGSWQLPPDLASRSILGLMFDWSGDDLLGTFTLSNGVPREACAVFLNEFDDLEPEVRASDIVWNAIHELGHVFNLVHDINGGSFMEEGGQSRPSTNHTFNGDDTRALTLAANGLNPRFSEIYLPGGANFRGAGPGSSRIRARGPLVLHATLGKTSYLLGEPIVLDLAIASERSTWIEPALDPGHEALEIWYETPEGETRRYRPALNFCRNPRASVEITRSRPLRHNPRIHLDRHGLVFSNPGTYRLWVVLNTTPLAAGRRVTSNELFFELRLPRTGDEVEISQTLRRVDVAKMVQDGGGPLSTMSRRALSSALRRHFGHAALAPVRYQLAKRSVRDRRYALAREYLDGLRLTQPSLAQGARRLRASLRSS